MSDASTHVRTFPEGFIFGAATASYQIEGAATEGGRGPSIWDTFARVSGKVLHKHNGDVACDHFHRYEDDVRLMAELGIQSYRFSIAWPRVVPAKGQFRREGFDFYKRLVEALRKHNISPAATIYHWDMPQWMEDEGGWSNRDIVERYVEFATAAFRELGDGIDFWITHNEPWCASMLSYGIGEHAPGLRDWRRAYRAAHHILLSHGEAVKTYRSLNQKGTIGITLNLGPADPATDHPDDVAAAARQDIFFNRWFLDPLFKAQYPAEFIPLLEEEIGPIDFIQPGDLETISTPADFLGINYYNRSVIKNCPESPFLQIQQLPTENKVTDMGWEVHPQSLYELLTRLGTEYTKLPLYITENGAAVADKAVDGKIVDQDRIDFVEGHLEAAARFIDEGGNLQGYYLWSLMDNFEWAWGYTKRFGIIYVDYETQQRIPKSSYYWYREVIASRSVPL